MKCPNCGKSLWFVKTVCPFCSKPLGAGFQPGISLLGRKINSNSWLIWQYFKLASILMVGASIYVLVKEYRFLAVVETTTGSFTVDGGGWGWEGRKPKGHVVTRTVGVGPTKREERTIEYDLSYSFTVRDMPYMGRAKNVTQEWMDKFDREGITVYYNRNNPTDCTLYPPGTKGFWIFLGISVATFLIYTDPFKWFRKYYDPG